jgi:DNA-3-methyladenine glycosylase I
VPSTGDARVRCTWATGPWLMPYHDEEWGVVTHDDRHHFEHLTLEGAQAGLSWLTILKRRDGYRRAFFGFDPAVVAAFGPDDVARLMDDTGIIRNRAKIESAIRNAAAFVTLQEEAGSVDDWLWAFVDARAGAAPVVNRWRQPHEVPASSDLSEALSKELRRRGFRFVGPVVCYSHLQSVGLVNDHLVGCFRHAQVGQPAPDTT